MQKYVSKIREILYKQEDKQMKASLKFKSYELTNLKMPLLVWDSTSEQEHEKELEKFRKEEEKRAREKEKRCKEEEKSKSK